MGGSGYVVTSGEEAVRGATTIRSRFSTSDSDAIVVWKDTGRITLENKMTTGSTWVCFDIGTPITSRVLSAALEIVILLGLMYPRGLLSLALKCQRKALNS